MDTPENFITRVIEADQYMVDNLDDKILMDILTGELISLPIPPIKSPINVALSRRIQNIYEDVKDIIANKPSCVDNFDTYGLLKFILKGETRFGLDIIDRTILNEYFNAPEGIEKTIIELDNIPLCW